MSTVTLINPTTDAVTAHAPIDARGNYDTVTLHATGLAAAEEVDIFIGGGPDWVTAVAPGGTAAAKLTAALPMITLPAALYGVTKDATAAAAGVYATLIQN